MNLMGSRGLKVAEIRDIKLANSCRCLWEKARQPTVALSSTTFQTLSGLSEL